MSDSVRATLLRIEMERVWREWPCRCACHVTVWRIATPASWVWMYGILRIAGYKGKWSPKRTKGQVARGKIGIT